MSRDEVLDMLEYVSTYFVYVGNPQATKYIGKKSSESPSKNTSIRYLTQTDYRKDDEEIVTVPEINSLRAI